MKRRKSEVNVFSMSALDLFASALGAFILLAVIFMPFFPNTGDHPKISEALRNRLQQAEAAVSRLQSQLDRQVTELERLQEAEARASSLESQLNQQAAALEEAQARVSSLESQLNEKAAELERLRNADERASSLQAQLNEQAAELERLRNADERASSLQAQNESLSKSLKNETDRMTLLGLETKAKKIGLLVDMSGSMNFGGSDFREILKDTVDRLLNSFEDDVEVFVMGFHAPNDVPSFPTVPSSGFLEAKQNISRINNEVSQYMNRVDGGTPTLEGLKKALSLNPEAIIILTDGAPSVPDDDWQNVVSQVNSANSQDIEIHAVAIGPFYDDKNFTLFLGRLVAENNGYLAAAVP